MLRLSGLYAKKALIRHCIAQGVAFVSQLRSDACLYQEEQQPKKRGRGRSRKHGERMGPPRELAEDPHGLQNYDLKPYGERRTIAVKRIEASGMKAWQCQIKGAVVRSVPLTCVATLFMLWSFAEARILRSWIRNGNDAIPKIKQQRNLRPC